MKSITFKIPNPTDEDINRAFAKAKRAFLMRAEEKFLDQFEQASKWIKEGNTGTLKMSVSMDIGEVTIETSEEPHTAEAVKS